MPECCANAKTDIRLTLESIQSHNARDSVWNLHWCITIVQIQLAFMIRRLQISKQKDEIRQATCKGPTKSTTSSHPIDVNKSNQTLMSGLSMAVQIGKGPSPTAVMAV